MTVDPAFITEDVLARLQAWHTRPVAPVHIVGSSLPSGQQTPAPEFSSNMTWQVPNFATPAQAGAYNFVTIGNRRLRRHRMRLWVPSISGGGVGGVQEIVGTQPAAGSPFTYTLTQPAALLSAAFTFTASATVANRIVYLQVADASGNIIFIGKNNTTVVASTSINDYMYQGASLIGAATGIVQSALPQNLVLQTGWVITITANGIQATDQISQVVLVLSNTASSSTASVVLASNLNQIANAQGMIIPASLIPFGGGGGLVWESQKPCYATCIGGTATIFALDESYSETVEEYE